MMKGLIVALISSLLLVSPVAAAKPAQVESSVTLDAANSQLDYNGYVAYTYTVEKLRGGESFAVWVVCYQNGGPVHAWYSVEGAAPVPLAGLFDGWSRWEENGGGDADCVLKLQTWSSESRGAILLAQSESFHVEG